MVGKLKFTRSCMRITHSLKKNNAFLLHSLNLKIFIQSSMNLFYSKILCPAEYRPSFKLGYRIFLNAMILMVFVLKKWFMKNHELKFNFGL